MSEVTWKMRTIDKSPYTGTVIFGQNEGDKKWIFIRNSCSTVMYAKLLGMGTQKTEISPHGIGGFAVAAQAAYGLVEIGVVIENEDWNWTYHNYENGATTPA